MKILDQLHVCAGEDRLSRGVDTHIINERCIGRTYKDPVGSERYVLESSLLGSFKHPLQHFRFSVSRWSSH